MTVKINATTAGLIESVDTSGTLEFQTGNSSAIVIGTDQNANFTSTTAITVPNGTTAQRPTPVNGMMRYNTSLSIFEIYANNTWSAANVSPAPTNTVAPVISGSAIVGQNLTSTTGTWSGSPSAYYYQWLANSTAISSATANVFSVTLAQVGANITCNVTAYNVAGNSTPATSNSLGPVIQGVTVNYLVVAGGGGGGVNIGGGGGAGGLLTGTTILQPANTYSITIGAGGAAIAGGTQSTTGINGSNTTFTALSNVAVGGGGGGYYGSTSGFGANGGSGGGAGGQSTPTVNGGTGTTSQGNNGGSSSGSGSAYSGGGGGGAGAVGGNASTGAAGNGGNGISSTISGVATYYAGGGGGAAYASGAVAGNGGSGGGGAGAISNSASGGTGSVNAASGTANTGGGGGGGSYYNQGGTNASGGSGIVIISYSGAQQFGGGVISTDGSNTIHTFYTSGSLVPITALSANYLLVAGGGGGGSDGANDGLGGGGGAGGFFAGSNVTIDSSSTYVITVGSGGSGAINAPTNGANSSFSAVTTITVGGGAGGYGSNRSGSSGGSGGGGAHATGTGGSGTASQGNAGGNGASSKSGGGGGAGAAGANAVASTSSGNGGVGLASSISGVSTYYAGGGGGAGSNAGSGGNGGGGAGGSTTGTSGTANTGGGGGGGVTGGGGSGGSGVVIISYSGSTPQMAGGNVTVVSNTVVHTFTSSGYLTPFVNVNNSLRFRLSNSAYISRTMSVPTDGKKLTISMWLKRGSLSYANNYLIGCYPTSSASDSNTQGLAFNSNDTLSLYGFATNYRTTNQVFRDPAAWYHLVYSYDSTQATAANREILYLNGTQITSFSTSNDVSQNTTNPLSASGSIVAIGTEGQTLVSGRYFDGEMTEVRMIDGQALGPNYFGAFNNYGVWQPVAYAGSYGSNGFYLPFTNTANTTALCYDYSGNSNNWTPTNISLTAGSTYDSMKDVPTLTSANVANYCVLNPVMPGDYFASGQSALALTSGNLNYGATGRNAFATMAVSSGKWYWEFSNTSNTGSASTLSGLVTLASRASVYGVYYNSSNGNKGLGILNSGASETSYGATWTDNDIIGVALDMDAATPTVTFYKNNSSQGAISVSSFVGQTVFAWMQNGANSNNMSGWFNFGQRPFNYTAPSGFLPLNTYNL